MLALLKLCILTSLPVLVASYVFAQEAVCQCSSKEARAKESLVGSIESSDIIFQGVVEDLIMIDAYNYIAKIKQKKIFHQNTDSKAPHATQGSGLVAKILNVGQGFAQSISEPEPRNLAAQQHLFVLSSHNPADCGLDLAVGWEYLIYGTLSGNMISVNECTRTAPIGERQDDIQELEKNINQNSKTAEAPKMLSSPAP